MHKPMSAFWTDPDFDDHEVVHFVHDEKRGLTAIIALHSTHLGPAAGGTRFWHYAEPAAAMRDALRLSRGMSYKNAMAGLPMGGGKAVILADEDRTKTPAMLAAFGDAVERLGGRYVTAEDVGISVADMQAVAERTSFVSGLPAEGDNAGGDPGPFTAFGIFLGIQAAAKFKLGRDSMDGVIEYLNDFGYETNGAQAIEMFRELDIGRRRQLARHMAEIAKADNELAENEVRLLRRTLELLGISPVDVVRSEPEDKAD